MEGGMDERMNERTEGRMDERTYTTRTQKRRAMTVLNDAGSEICNASLNFLFETALVLEYVRPLWTLYNSKYTVEFGHVGL